MIINFTKENFKLLQQKPFPDDLYKRIKHDYFFDRMKNAVGRPKDTEIAHTMIFYMIRRHMLKSEDELNDVLDLPFFKKSLLNQDMYRNALRLRNPESYVIVDPSRIDDVDYRQTIEEELRKKILVENEQFFKDEREKYKTEIEVMKRQLATIPTILEAEEYKEPDIEPDDIEQKQEWWQILNLKDDPFPLAEGLKRIDKALYEQIFVKTEVFNRYANYAVRLQTQIFKNSIFYGDFGSGKTAFFDYLGEILLRNKIMSISISIWPVADVDTNIHKFEQELLYNLGEECDRYKVGINDGENTNFQRRIRNRLLSLKEQRGFNGFIVFVDDLHKNPKAFDAVIDFLSYLQIFTSSITRGVELPLALYVAGIPHWRNRISSDPRLSGSLIRDEIFPETSEFDAHDMLNKRLLAYSKNPEKKNIIGPGFVKQVYEALKSTQQSITFREFLKSALAEFKNNNFDILTVNPKAISTERLHSIKDIILKRPKLNYQFEKLLSLISNANAENRQRCFELLGSIHLDGSILENSQKAERNKWALQQLERCGLIRPVQGAEIKWVVGKEMVEVNKEIIGIHGVSMEDYLIPIFVGSPVIRRRSLADRPELVMLNAFLEDKLSENLRLLIKEAVRLHEQLVDIDRSHAINIVPEELVAKCVMSLSYLTKVFVLSQNLSHKASDDLDVLMFWTEFPLELPSVTEFVNQIIETKESLDINSANYIFSRYKDAFLSVADFIKNQRDKDRIFMITYKDLTPEDVKIIYQAREDWLQKEYFMAAAGIAEHLEKRIRETAFNIFSLLYGPFEKRIRRLDDDAIRKRVFENISKDEKKGLTRALNELQYLDRKDYKSLLTKASKTGHLNWEEIFKYVFTPWDEDALSRFLNNFATINTATAHVKTEVISADQQSMLFQFLIEAMTFLQMLNRSYRMLLDTCLYEKDKNYYLSFHKLQDRQALTEIAVSGGDAKKLIQRLSGMEVIALPFNNISYIETFFNIDYRAFVAIIARLLHLGNDEFKMVGCKMKVLKDMSPMFHLEVELKENPISGKGQAPN